MQGKHKPNRTKNNAKPSSSARSAELLGSQTPTFFGLGTVKDGTISMIPGVSGTIEDDPTIDTNFQLALKKMAKKDSTTKMKALQEFADLCNKADVNEVKAILPFWPRLYSQLCGDSEHRVREAAHISHKAVIAKVKKYLAPYLKEIIGPWFTSQYDTYAPAASAATAAFQEAFSGDKMAKVVAFCQDEILNYFHQNLTVHTPQTLSNPKTNSSEEMEDKYRRVVSSSLLGYGSYIEKVPPAQLEASSEANKKILSSAKFWKLSSHKDPLIRHGFYSALVSLCQHAAILLSGEVSRLSSAIFNNLNENDPLVVPVLWDAVLQAVMAVPECWNNSNVRDRLIPKLLQSLKSGSRGHASNIFPKILLLLSAMPTLKLGENTNFLNQLFSSMRSGLSDPLVNRSQSESKVVAGTFIECLQYIVMLNKEDENFVRALVCEQLVPAIEAKVVPFTPPQHTSGPLFYHVAQLLKIWHRNAPLYVTATKQFWSQLQSVLQSQLANTVQLQDINEILKNQTELLSALSKPIKPRSENDRVRFADASDDSCPSTPTKEVPVPEFDVELQNLAQAMCSSYGKLFLKNDNSQFLEAIISLAQTFDSRAIFEAASGDKDLFKLFEVSVDKNAPHSILVQLGLHLLPHLNNSEERSILESLAKMKDLDLMILCRGLLSASSSSVKTWIQGETFSNIYLKLMQEYLQGNADDAAGIIILGFLTPKTLINLETCQKMVRSFDSILKHEDSVIKRLGLVIEGLGRDVCLTAEFGDLVSSTFISACSENGEVFQPLLRLCLLKTKCFRVLESDSWLTLAHQITKKLNLANIDAIQTSTVVMSYIGYACDVPAWSSCEAEEIQEAVPLLKVFLEQPQGVLQSSANLKKIVFKSSEVIGNCSFQYFMLKNMLSDVPNMKVDEDLLACSPADSDLLRAYRLSYTAAKCENDDKQVTIQSLKNYLKWLQISTASISSLFNAYPLSVTYEDLNLPGRYIVIGQESSEQLTDNADIIPRYITPAESEELNSEKNVRNVFSKDDYPDENMIVPLGNIVLDLVEGAALLDHATKNLPEIECYPLISSESCNLMKMVRDLIGTVTPSEFEFLYSTCSALVATEASWCALRPSLSSLFSRRFLQCQTQIAADDAIATVAHCLSGTGLVNNPDNVLKLTAVIKNQAHCVSLDHWNDIFIQLENALGILRSDEENANVEMKLLQSAAISNFFIIAQECFKNCLERADDERLLPELVQMWDDIVEKELWLALYNVWRGFIPSWQSEIPDQPGQSTESRDGSCRVLTRRVCEALVSSLQIRQPEPMDLTLNLVRQCSQLLLSPQVALQYTSFRLLISLVPELVQEDTETFQKSVAETPQNEDKALFTRTRDCDWTIKQLVKALDTAQTVVDALLSDLKAGDTCTVQPFTDAFTYAHGFLLLWCVVMEMCGEAHVALRFQYAAYLKSNGYLPALLKALFNLMPAYVVHGESVRDTAPLFQSYGNLDLTEAASSYWIEHRACFVYRMCLQRLPAAVREWWSEADHHVGSLVARTTSLHVSPILIASELKAVQNETVAELENITVAVSPIAREVVGTYVIDEAAMQIIISLPVNYPLGTIKVDFKAQTVIPRAWKISMFLVHRNGSLRDALALWKSDLDKKFEGIEECEICFSILHGANYDIPKQSCKTCRKKFHSACLYKWFSTSNKSSCPHCRNQY